MISCLSFSCGTRPIALNVRLPPYQRQTKPDHNSSTNREQAFRQAAAGNVRKQEDRAARESDDLQGYCRIGLRMPSGPYTRCRASFKPNLTCSQDDADLQPISMLYINIKPADAPLAGIPLEEEDTTFVPFTERAARRSRRGRNGFDPAVQHEQLSQRISVARAEAGMLTDSLAYTSPDEVGKSEIVQEFYAKVLAWQDFVVDQLPWVQAEADKAHEGREAIPVEQRPSAGEAGSTKEEVLLDSMLQANGEISEALAHYHRT